MADRRENRDSLTDVASTVAAVTAVGLTFSASFIAAPIAMGLAAVAAGVGAYLKLHDSGHQQSKKKESPPSLLAR